MLGDSLNNWISTTVFLVHIILEKSIEISWKVGEKFNVSSKFSNLIIICSEEPWKLFTKIFT